jgi:hypothetical protein
MSMRQAAGNWKLAGRFMPSVPSSATRTVTTTARYLNVKDDYLQELIERKPLTLVKN